MPIRFGDGTTLNEVTSVRAGDGTTLQDVTEVFFPDPGDTTPFTADGDSDALQPDLPTFAFSDWTGSAAVATSGAISFTNGNAASVTNSPSQSFGTVGSSTQRVVNCRVEVPANYSNTGDFVTGTFTTNQAATSQLTWNESAWTGSRYTNVNTAGNSFTGGSNGNGSRSTPSSVGANTGASQNVSISYNVSRPSSTLGDGTPVYTPASFSLTHNVTQAAAATYSGSITFTGLPTGVTQSSESYSGFAGASAGDGSVTFTVSGGDLFSNGTTTLTLSYSATIPSNNSGITIAVTSLSGWNAPTTPATPGSGVIGNSSWSTVGGVAQVPEDSEDPFYVGATSGNWTVSATGPCVVTGDTSGGATTDPEGFEPALDCLGVVGGTGQIQLFVEDSNGVAPSTPTATLSYTIV